MLKKIKEFRALLSITTFKQACLIFKSKEYYYMSFEQIGRTTVSIAQGNSMLDSDDLFDDIDRGFNCANGIIEIRGDWQI